MRSWNVTCYAPIGRIRNGEGAEKQTNDTTRAKWPRRPANRNNINDNGKYKSPEMRGETLNCMAIVVLWSRLFSSIQLNCWNVKICSGLRALITSWFAVVWWASEWINPRQELRWQSATSIVSVQSNASTLSRLRSEKMIYNTRDSAKWESNTTIDKQRWHCGHSENGDGAKLAIKGEMLASSNLSWSRYSPTNWQLDMIEQTVQYANFNLDTM